MESKINSVRHEKLQFNRGNPESPSAYDHAREDDLSDEENQIALASEEEEKEEEKRQLAEEERDREIERTYEEEDESNKRDWARF